MQHATGQTHTPPTPRGDRRVLFVSDPSSALVNILPDQVQPSDLAAWVDMLADAGVDMFQQDVYNQACTVYWRSDRFQYDPREQHKKLLPMLEAGVQPLQVLIDQCRKRDLLCLAGFRMNDNHTGAHFPSRTGFIESHPQWLLVNPDQPDNPDARCLDFSHDGVRQFIFEVIEELIGRFDVDGLELTFREPAFFPFPHGGERAGLMTDLVRRIRDLLDEHGRSRGRRLLLSARAYNTPAECLELGLDVQTWIADGLIDLVCPMDPMFSDFNAPVSRFADLTRKSKCMLLPGLEPWPSQRARERLKGIGLTGSQQRALVHSFYNGGADGFSVYNHFVAYLYALPMYPQALQNFHELRDPKRVALGDRHYVFDPNWESETGIDPPRNTRLSIEAEQVVLDRTATNPSGVFHFQLYEQADRVRAATLLVRGSLTEHDEIAVQLNGQKLAPGPLGKPDLKFLRPFPNIRWFPVPPAAFAWADNALNITLTGADPNVDDRIVIDELEVWVQPV